MDEFSNTSYQPEDYVIADLDDEETRGFLFAEFKPKNFNIHSWTLKMKFWKIAVQEMLAKQTNRSFLVSANSVSTSFERDGLRPLCIREVLMKLHRDQDRPVQLANQYLTSSSSGACRNSSSSSSQGWMSWGFSTLVTRPLSWSASYLYHLGAGTEEAAHLDEHVTNDTKFVIPSMLKAESMAYMAKLEGLVRGDEYDHLIPMSRAISLSPYKIESLEFQLILKYLGNNGFISLSQPVTSLSTSSSSSSPSPSPSLQQVIKLCSPGSVSSSLLHHHTDSVISSGASSLTSPPSSAATSVSSMSDNRQLTELEASIVKLKETIGVLTDKLSKSQAQVDSFDEQCRNLLRDKQKAQAKMVLRKKKLLEREVEKKEQTLTNLELLLERLINSNYDRRVIDAYKTSAKALKEITNDGDLTDLNNTMDDIHDMLDLSQDVSEAIATEHRYISNRGAEDEDGDELAELEAELNDLLAAPEEDEENTAINNVVEGEIVDTTIDLDARLARLKVGSTTDLGKNKIAAVSAVEQRKQQQQQQSPQEGISISHITPSRQQQRTKQSRTAVTANLSSS